MAAFSRRFPTGGILTLVRVVFDDSGGQPARMAAALRAPAHLPPLQPDRHPRLLDSLERIGRLAEPRLDGKAAGTTRRGIR